MGQDLSGKRRIYAKSSIDFLHVPPDPMELFESWYKEVETSKEIAEPYAATLSTLGSDGFPRSRIILIREYDPEGFVFYTNYDSDKGLAIESEPKVCLSFFWDVLERQVIIKGLTTKILPERSDEYFGKRPRESRIGARVSAQSRVMAPDVDLQAAAEKLTEDFEGKEIPRPENWGGYLIRPVEVEFWQGRPSRLHDRLRYRLQDGSWIKERLYP